MSEPLTGETQVNSALSQLKRTLAALKAAREKLDRIERARTEPIAIIGMGCRMPGGENPEEFWRLLHEGRDAITEVPRDRWDLDEYFDADPEAPGKMYTRWGAFLPHVDRFDAAFFGISPREARAMDPQQRLLLEVTWETLESAGYAPGALSGSPVGVFVGISTADYGDLASRRGTPVDAYSGTGGANSLAAGRLSYQLGLRGPCFAVDTACSSALVALHQACMSLRAGECSMALVGGVNVILVPEGTVYFSKVRAMSPTGRCRTFDADADGYVRGEGCGVVALKRLSHALRDRDHVLAVVRSSAVNHDGRSNGLTAPNGMAQREVIRRALEFAAIDPLSIGYIEAHGTGTPLGDPIEVEALVSELCTNRPAASPLVIGSVKTNVGHLEAAAGMSGLIKLILMMVREEIPPHLHFSTPSPHIPWDEWPVEVPVEARRWAGSGSPRRAGLSSFGFAGTNAHIILEEAPASLREEAGEEARRDSEILAISARDAAAVKELGERFAAFLADTQYSLADIAYTAGTGRSQFGYRLAVEGGSKAEVRERLLQALHSGDRPAADYVVNPKARKVPVPTYPFQRQRYWGEFEANPREEAAEMPREPGSRVLQVGGEETRHPLLGRRLRSALPEAQFEGSVGRGDTKYLFDHRVFGHAIFPAAGYVEAGLAAMAFISGDGRREMKNLVIREPLVLAAGGTNVQVILRQANEEAAYEFYSMDAEPGGPAKWRLHATGAVSPAAAVGSGIGLEQLQAQCPEEMEPEAYYAALRRRGADYGASFRVLTCLRRGEDQAVARVQLPEDLRYEAERYEMHPALLDGALHMLGACVRSEGGDETTAWMPIAVEGVRVDIRALPEMWAHAVIGRGGAAGTLIGNIEFFNTEGHAAGAVRGVTLKRTDRGALERASKVRIEEWLYEVRWRPEERDGATQKAETGGEWIILEDGGGIGRELAERLTADGESCRVIAVGVALDSPDAVAEILRETGLCHAVIDLRSECRTALYLAQAMARVEAPNTPRLWMVTRGAQAVDGLETGIDAAQATLWGLAKSVGLEHPELRPVVIDIAELEGAAERLYEEVRAPDGESEIAYRGGVRFVARLSRSPEAAIPTGPVRLAIAERGELHGLVFRRVETVAPGPGEVEIRVHAAALNFLDVMNALGTLPIAVEHPGIECAGEVISVGEGVREFAPGDAVVAIGQGCFGSRTVTRAELVAKKPAGLSFEEAATLPIAGLTALLVRDAGGIGPGLRVLIHAAAGGVGLAAVRLAQAAGAEIFATAGSEEKRAYLRGLGVPHVMDSRSLEFAREIAETTGGEGIDVVLNSLNGEFIEAGLRVLRPGGRFIEIGKAGIWSTAQAAEVRPDVAYEVIALDRLAAGEPARVGRMLRELMEVDTKALPYRRFRMSEAEAAFRYMAQAKHIGKIVLSGLKGSPVTLLSEPERTCVITGGLGSLGLLTAEWLAGKGVRNMLLISRSQPGAEAAAGIERLRAAGVRVLVGQADVSRLGDLRRVLEEAAAEEMPPIGGVIHAAGVLDDGVLLQQTWERFEKVLAAKAEGAWNLHELTRELKLDFFVLYSSAVSVLGSPGQSNYAAANAYLDALAQHRRAQGLAALSINWAAWTGVGMAARRGTGARLALHGIDAIAPAQGMEILERAFGFETAGLAAIPIQWPKVLAQFPAGGYPPLLEEMAAEWRGRGARSLRAAADSELLRRWNAAADGEREGALIAYLREQTAKVLGLPASRTIERDRPLRELGLDSLMAVELRNVLGKAAGVPLPTSLLFEYPTIDALAGYLSREVLSTIAAVRTAAPTIVASEEPIAVIGMGCRFPGATGLADYWDLLRNGVDAITEIPPERWDADAYYDPDPEAPGKMYTRWGGFLRDVDQFDAEFFGISPREAIHMDPQQRMLLEVSWEAIEHAGQNAQRLVGEPVGVFLGICTNDYIRLGSKEAVGDVYHATGNSISVAAGRISYLLGLQGPAISVDTACSSSLVAIHLACQSLRSGESTMALAAGVNLILAPEININFCKTRMMSADGRCKTFDADADGYVRGEGCGVVVLKRLSDARANGDRILGVIRSSAVNQDGRSNGLTAPNGLAQEAVIRRALETAGVTADDLGYIETHGTGTSLGDPIEVQALGRVLGERAVPLPIGAVKTNVGHLEAAAGIAGVIKVLLALNHGEIPPTLHLRKKNPYIRWEEVAVEIPTERKAWPRGERARIAGVSSFGFSGTNAHVILEEAPVDARPAALESAVSRQVLMLSARSEAALEELAGRYREYLGSNPAESFEDIAWTACAGRSHFGHRMAVVAGSVAEAARLLEKKRAVAVEPSGLEFEITKETAAEEIVRLYEAGGTPLWEGGASTLRRATLPGYAFQRERYWVEEVAAAPVSGRAGHPLAGERVVSALAEAQFTGTADMAVVKYLGDHRVYGHVIYPAAAFIELAMACAREVTGQQTPGLFDIAIEEPLLLEAGESATVNTILRPGEDGTWGLEIRSLGGDEEWRLHFRAQVRGEGQLGGWAWKAEWQEAGEELAVGPFYAATHGIGLQLGPMFQGIRRLRREKNAATGELELPARIRGEAGRYGIHPVLLDAAFQLLIAAAGEATEVAAGECFLPVAMEGVAYRTSGAGELKARAVLRETNGPDTITADISIFDAQGQVVGAIDGFVARRAGREALERAAKLRIEEWLYEVRWRPKERDGAIQKAEFLADPADIRNRVLADFDAAGVAAEMKTFAQAIPGMERLSALYASRALMELGDTPVTERHRRLVQSMRGMVEQGISGDPAQLAANVLGEYPACAPELGLLTRCGSGLASVLRGETDPLELLFPGGSVASAEEFYESSPGMRVWNALMQKAVTAALAHRPAGRRLRVLELGAGTGGTTTYLLDALPAGEVEYVFTDIGPLFLERARTKFAKHPFFRFESLDIEKAPEPQGFAPHQFDLIIAANVLHATADLTAVLANVRRLLAPGGMLALLEATTRTRWTDLVFGLTEGWWKFTDTSLRPSHALLSANQWLGLLEGCGFAGVAAITGDGDAGLPPGQAVILGRTDADEKIAFPETGGAWIIFEDGGGIASELAERLRADGESCRMIAAGVALDSPGAVAEILRETGPCHAVIDLRSECRTALYLAHAIARVEAPNTPRLWMVTRGAQAVDGLETGIDAAQATLWGLAKSVGLEHPELRPVAIDIAELEGAAERLYEELRTPDGESEIAYRGGMRWVPRLGRSPEAAVPTGPVRLTIAERGDLRGLRFRRVETVRPGPGEVEIRIRAAGLNFRDVMNAMGTLPVAMEQMGFECAGDVLAVGEGVSDLAPGDAVVAIGPGCFGSRTVTRAELAAKKPDGLSYEEAATLPIAGLTAVLALREAGGIGKGARVLIHAASGGVGLAAVRLAREAGAEIFATAGSKEKRAYMRAQGVAHVMDSRSLDFAREIAEMTGGEGIDVVLNSLNGEFIAAGMSVLRPGGRFIEIGRAGIWSAEQAAEVRPDVVYEVIALDRMMEEEPARVGALLRELMVAGAAALPYRRFRMSEAEAAFRYMAQAKHIGKIVLTGLKGATVTLLSQPARTCVITGGLGSLGLLTAEWLAGKGVRNMILISRSQPGAEATAGLERLRAAGVRVLVGQADVSRLDELRRVLEEAAAAEMPPIGGVIHAAGVLDDGVLLQQTWERFEKVLAAKAEGAWNLHELTRELKLDFFVLYSSAVSVLGSPGQSNHAAASAFLDALAQHRRAQGLVALSINWAAWTGIGAAARKGAGAKFALHGINAIAPAQGMEILERAFGFETAGLAAIPIQWPKLLAQFPAGGYPPLLEEMAAEWRGRGAGSPRAADSELLRRWNAAPAAEREGTLISYLREQAAKVLGLPASRTIERDRPLRELGLDSLMAVELRNVLGKAAGITLSASLLFDYPTIDALAGYLSREVLTTFAAPLVTAAPAIIASEEPIAVIGMGCRFPGATGLAGYWDLLRNSVDAITEIPPERWDADAYYDPDPDAPGKMYTRWGGFLRDVDQFDAEFFGISPREAIHMDPQQRMLLEVSWEAIEHAGQNAQRLAGEPVGVFLGICTNDYIGIAGKNGRSDAYLATGSTASVAAGRISYLLGLQGPAISVDTACSSSLVAVHLACQSLRSGESTMALAAGVNLILLPEININFCRSRMLSADGRCKTFDASADGFVRGEGCGVVVLKRLSAARADGDRILGVIRGSAVNQDGRSNGLTAPNGLAQEAVIRRALETAGVTADDLGYIETHGTGTSLGDPIEVQALGRVLGERAKALPIGAVKTNVGHLEAAAGIAGVIKVLLALNHGEIPPTLHLRKKNPYIRWESVAVEIPTERKAWPRGERARLAGVSSFGFSGTNAHVIIEEAPVEARGVEAADERHVLMLSAKTAGAVEELAGRYREYLGSNPEESFADIAWTACAGRSHFGHRMAVVAGSAAEAARLLENKRAVVVEATGVEFEVTGDTAAEEIVRLYESGGTPRWQENKAGLRKATLPGYAFQRERYWVEEAAAAPVSVRAGHVAGHPLAGERLVSALPDAQFTGWADIGVVKYLGDHRIYGHVIYPAAAFIELAMACAREVTGQQTPGLYEIAIEEPLLLEAGESATVNTILRPREDGTWGLEIRSLGGDEEWRLHFRAEVRGEGRLDSGEWKAEWKTAGEELAVGPFYAATRGAGLQLGAMFQGIRRLRLEKNAATGELELPARIRREAGLYGIHPVLLDAAFQLLIVAAGEATEAAGECFLPVAVDRVAYRASDAGELKARAVLRETAAADTITVDIGIFDAQGQVVGAIDGFVARRVPKAVLDRAIRRAAGDWHYGIEWKLEPLVQSAEARSGAWRILGEPGALRQHLEQRLPMGEHASNTLYLCGEQSACRDILHLVQEPGASRLWIVTVRSQCATAQDRDFQLANATVWGLARVVALERPELGCVRIDIDDPAVAAEALTAELLYGGGEDQIALRGGDRLVPRLGRLNVEEAPPLKLREDRSYLITGGCGGLGMLAAGRLLERGARSLILMGRRGASAAAEETIRGWRATGASVAVLAADVSKTGEVKRAFERMAELPPLAGVIHAAGVLDDGVIVQQTWERFETVMAPKISGAWNLHEMTREMPLDFFVLFSSAASVFGFQGQSNYVAANAFLDLFAHYRRAEGLPATVINWGPWSGAGLAARSGSRSLRGVTSITPDRGLEILERLLTLAEPAQIAVAAIKWAKFVESLPPENLNLFRELMETEQTRGGGRDNKLFERLRETAEEQRREVLQAYIAEQTARVMKIGRGKSIDPRQPLSELGMDSLMAVELRNALGRSLGRTLPATLLFDYPSISGLTGYLLDEVLHLAPRPPEAASGGALAGSALADELSRMTDDEAEAMLLRRLDDWNKETTTA